MVKQLLVSRPEPVDEYSLPGLGLPLAKAHGKFLERYRAKLIEGKWPNLPNDGYIIQHLAWHLVQAGFIEELYQLINDKDWMHAAYALQGTYDGFLGDVEVARKQAEKDFRDLKLSEAKRAKALTMQVECALCVSSVAALSGNYPGELLALAVENDLLTSTQALVIARQKTEESERVEALVKIIPAIFPKLNADQQQTILTDMLAIVNIRFRAEALVRCYLTLAPESKKAVLEEALVAIRALSENEVKIEVLIALIRNLPPEERGSYLAEALAMVKTISRKSQALCGLAPFLPPKLMGKALKLATGITDERFKVYALSGMALFFPLELMDEVLSVVKTFYDFGFENDVFIRVGPTLANCTPGQSSRNDTKGFGG